MKPKIKIKFLWSVAVVTATLFFGCSDEKNSPLENGLFIAEAAPNKTFPQQIETVTINGETSKSLTAKLARPTSEDVKVTFELDQTVVDEYNAKNGMSYEMLPEKYLEFETGKEIVIPAGMTTASQTFTMKPYTASNGETYALGVRMRYLSGPVGINGNADHMLYLLAVPHKQKALKYNARADKWSDGVNGVKFVPDGQNVEMKECTLEFWIKVNNKTHYVFNSDDDWFGSEYDKQSKRTQVFGGGSGSSPLWVGSNFGLRFWGGGEKGPQLQCRADDTNTDFESGDWWKPDTWFHIAYAYDGNNVTLYKDGSVDKVHPRQQDYKFTNLQFPNLTGQMEVEIAQLRLWRVCRSKDQIVTSMSRPVPDDSEGLYAYWPCDEGEGTTLHGRGEFKKDITIKGMSWSEKEYNFSDPNGK